jgi:reactive intermediate/imine deaminase
MLQYRAVRGRMEAKGDTSMTQTSITTPLAPVPVAAYSQAVKVNETVYLAGQGGFDPATGELAGDDMAGQTRQALTNLRHVIEAAGGSLADFVSVRVFITDHALFPEMNEVYGEFFAAPYPARTTVTTGLGPGMKVEIDAIAVLSLN